MGALSLAEVALFGAYFQHVRKTTRLRGDCLDPGCATVAAVAEEIDRQRPTFRLGSAPAP